MATHDPPLHRRSPTAVKSTLARGSIRRIIAIAMANQALNSHAQLFSSRPARLGATDGDSLGSTGLGTFALSPALSERFGRREVRGNKDALRRALFRCVNS